jgi:hypothetical protein
MIATVLFTFCSFIPKNCSDILEMSSLFNQPPYIECIIMKKNVMQPENPRSRNKAFKKMKSSLIEKSARADRCVSSSQYINLSSFSTTKRQNEKKTKSMPIRFAIKFFKTKRFSGQFKKLKYIGFFIF